LRGRRPRRRPPGTRGPGAMGMMFGGVVVEHGGLRGSRSGRRRASPRKRGGSVVPSFTIDCQPPLRPVMADNDSNRWAAGARWWVAFTSVAGRILPTVTRHGSSSTSDGPGPGPVAPQPPRRLHGGEKKKSNLPKGRVRKYGKRRQSKEASKSAQCAAGKEGHLSPAARPGRGRQKVKSRKQAGRDRAVGGTEEGAPRCRAKEEGG